MKTKYFLGIETSCDDTSMAVIKTEEDNSTLLAHLSYDQTVSLKKWKGVVPEIAARNHLKMIPPTLKEVLLQSQLKGEQLDCIGVTTHPGLLGPLLTGINCAKTLALMYEKPLLPVNHLFAHLEAIQLSNNVPYPYLGVLISGGHSLFIYVQASDQMKVLASTIDDAAGEAFDKAGKMLGLDYPAGPIIDKLAKQGEKKFNFPIGLKSSGNANLSFSGLKTSLRVFLENNSHIKKSFETVENNNISQDVFDLCASYQDAIAGALTLKARYIVKDYPNLPIVLGGGVACNSEIRSQFAEKFKNVYFVEPQFCTDNGAMIANYTRINYKNALPFPHCLELDGKSRYIDKKEFIR